jgi:steroid 5-alpha reductase family enzyme
MSWEILAAWALAAFCVLFGLCRVVAGRIDNYGIIDVLWSYSFALLVLGIAFFSDGWPVRRALIAAMVCAWSVRLGTHVLLRVIKHHPEEDARYAQLRKTWGQGFSLKMTGFFQLQAASVIFLGIPFFAICRNDAEQLSPFEVAGALVWLIAVAGEALADHQLAAFKQRPASRGRVCDEGLWRYSRHPNYFFEWCIWMGFFIFACGSPWGWVGIASPACILYLLLSVTGIPMTEEQSLRSKGDAYRRYQAVTSAFVPLPRKSHD